MSSSQWLDIAVLAVAFIAAVSGWRSGALGSLLSFVGVLLGAIAGVLLAPHLVAHVAAPRAKLFAALFLILALVVVGEVAGVVLGRAVRGAIHSNSVRFFDSLVGVAVQLVVVLVAAWLLATPLTSSAGQPSLAAAVRGSRVLGEVNDYAPEWLKTVPKRLSALLDTSGLPQVLEPFSRTPVVAVAAPDAALAKNPVVANTEPSVVKIRAIAPCCSKSVGGQRICALTGPRDDQCARGRRLEQRHRRGQRQSVRCHRGVVRPDHRHRDSVGSAPAGRTAVVRQRPVTSGTEGIVMGYPGGGGFMATPARIRELIELNGPDIYRKATINREVYTVRANVEQGNSGGPLIDLDGQVIGVVFGAAVDDNDTGFVLTAKEVATQLAHIGDTTPVPTGECVS